MAGKSDILAGRAYVELFLKNNMIKPLRSALQEAKKAMGELGRAAKEVGNVLLHASTAVLAPLSAVVFTTDDMKAKLGDVHRVLADAISPALKPILDQMLEIAAGAALWAGQHPEIVRQTYTWASAVGAVAFGLKLTTDAIKVATVGMAILSAVATPAGIVIAAIAAALALVAYSFLSFTSEGRELAWQMTKKWEELQQKIFGTASALQNAGKVALDNAAANRELANSFKEVASAASMTNSIISAWNRRQALVDEQATEEERYLKKREQIWQALAELNRNRVLGFVGEDEARVQRAQLEEAIRRLDRKEAERRAALLKKPKKEEEPAHEEKPKSFQIPVISDPAAILRGNLAVNETAAVRLLNRQIALQERIALAAEALERKRLAWGA